MRKTTLSVALMLILLPGLLVRGDMAGFEGGANDITANLDPPLFETTVNITVPAEYRALKATMNITGMAAKGNSSAFPNGVQVDGPFLDEKEL